MASLPVTSKTYSLRANAPFDSTSSRINLIRSMTFNLKQHMIDTLATGTLNGSRHANSVWTVIGSSNSVAAALDTVDRWAAIANLVFASGGTAHSWIVIQNTTLGYQVCIDCLGDPTLSQSIGFHATKIATPFTGGTTLVRPTSTTEFSMQNGSYGFVGDIVTGGSNYTHYVTADDGQFFFSSSRSGTGMWTSFAAMQKTHSAPAGDTNNVFLISQSSQVTGRGSPFSTGAFLNNQGCCGRNSHGTSNTTGGLSTLQLISSTYYTGGVDALTSDYLAFPMSVMSLGSETGYRGRISDMYHIGTVVPIGDSVPSIAAQERIIMGDYIVPFPGIIPLI